MQFIPRSFLGAMMKDNQFVWHPAAITRDQGTGYVYWLSMVMNTTEHCVRFENMLIFTRHM
jgi:hypothetical protein